MLKPYKKYVSELLESPRIVSSNIYGKLVTYEPAIQTRKFIIFIGGWAEKHYKIFENKGVIETRKFKFLGLDNLFIDRKEFSALVWLWKGEFNHGIEEIAAGLDEAIKDISDVDQIYLIAHSKGGNIACCANKNVKKVFTLGCPFRGTPSVQPELLYKYGRQSLIGKIFWYMFKKVFTGAVWDYQIACDNEMSITEKEICEVEEQLSYRQMKYHYVQQSDSFIRKFKSRSFQNVINFVGKIRKTIPHKFGIVEISCALSAKYFFGKIPGAEHGDGIVPWPSAKGEDLKIRTLEYPESLTHLEYISNEAVCKYFFEKVFYPNVE